MLPLQTLCLATLIQFYIITDSILHHVLTLGSSNAKFSYSLLISGTALLPQVTANSPLAREPVAFSLKQPTEHSTEAKREMPAVHTFLLSRIF